MTSCLITGGAGAIGSNLAASLVEHGHDVTIIDDLSSGRRNLVPPGARFIEGSIESEEKLTQAFATRPQWVFHLAALFANQNSVEHPERDLLVNGRGTIKVLEYAVSSGVQKLLFSSSSCVYGHKEIMREDDIDFDLDTPYAITKLLGEQYCKYWSRAHGLDTVIVRLFNTYGPHEYPGTYRNVVPNFIKLAMRGEPLPITGTGEETRDFNFVGDIVEGLMGAMQARTPPGEVYNLASGTGTRIINLAHDINEIAGNKAGVAFKSRRGWDRVLNRRGDSSKANAAFEFSAKTPLAEGLARTYAWIKSADA
jgi:nucleoside-diphosphate-sugar epimerase